MPFPFNPPLADIRFVLSRLIGLDQLTALPAYASVSQDLIDAVLEEAGKIASDVFAPLNDVGDKCGIKFADSKITMPPGFKEAYKAFIDGGWNGLPIAEEYGGQGLPWLIAMPVLEMLQSANTSLALCPLLNQGAIELLATHGNDKTKSLYLPKLVSGEWCGTMNLTEPQAGSDVGAVGCKATKENDHYRIKGQKIFISYGDHDLTENILHMVLARLPASPEGTRGLSLFLVPKILVNDNGSLGKANDVRVVSVEHKLGQHSSPTCVMAFGDHEGALGYLIGEENGGMAAMFTMMNNARINVGIQGLGLMERAYQHARDYAKFRIQGRPIDNPKAAPVTIIHHADVRRMVLEMKAYTEAARALAYHAALANDISKRSADQKLKAEAQARVSLLTPIVKAWITDMANEVTSTGVQIFGGMGYIEEAGAAQHMRDARILAIYEGTNGIQAQDLLFRKLIHDQGAAFNKLMEEIDAFLSDQKNKEADQLKEILENLSHALTALKKTAAWILQNGKEQTALLAASSVPFLKLCGHVLGGYFLIRSAYLAEKSLKTKEGDSRFLKAKIMTAHFYAMHILPLCPSLALIVQRGGGSVIEAASLGFDE